MDSATTDGPLLSRPGIEISTRLIDLHGRTFAVRQINAVKIDACAHPSAAGLSIFAMMSGCFCLLTVAVLLFGLSAVNDGHSDAWNLVGIAFCFFAVALTVCIMATRALHRLPRWGRLRFEMSNGSVRALDAEIAEVQEVARAIRKAMNQ